MLFCKTTLGAPIMTKLLITYNFGFATSLSLYFLGCKFYLLFSINNYRNYMIKLISPNQIIISLWFSVFFPNIIHDSSVVQSCPTLQPHKPQHTRPPCPSPTPKVYPNPCPLSWWCYAISSSLIPFSSCPQSFPAGCFQVSQLFAPGGQSIGVSTSTSVLPMNTQEWSLGWTGWISLESKGLSRVFSNATVQEHQFFRAQISL